MFIIYAASSLSQSGLLKRRGKKALPDSVSAIPGLPLNPNTVNTQNTLSNLLSRASQLGQPGLVRPDQQ